MGPQELKPGDVLLFKPNGKGLYSWLMRRLVDYSHVAIYWTETRRGLPLIIESIGRGVLIRSLYCYTGKQVRVMRPRQDTALGERAAKTAERLADHPASWYGYWDIPRYVLPKLLLAKLNAWLPLRFKLPLWLMAHTYRHNSVYICSELVTIAYSGAGYSLVDGRTIPLPDDLAESPRLQLAGELEL
jgi:hypothetical protein